MRRSSGSRAWIGRTPSACSDGRSRTSGSSRRWVRPRRRGWRSRSPSSRWTGRIIRTPRTSSWRRLTVRWSVSARSRSAVAPLRSTRVEGWPVRLTGETFCALAEGGAGSVPALRAALESDGQAVPGAACLERGARRLLVVPRLAPLGVGVAASVRARADVSWVRETPPLAFVKRGVALFSSACEMVALAEERRVVAGPRGAGVRGRTARPGGAGSQRRNDAPIRDHARIGPRRADARLRPRCNCWRRRRGS